MKSSIFLVLVVLFTTVGSNYAQENYGHDSNGKFWLSNCLYMAARPDMVPELITRVTEGKPVPMHLEGNLWVVDIGLLTDGSEIYCFKVFDHDGKTKYIPDVFYWDKAAAKRSAGLIRECDIVPNLEGNGHNLQTGSTSY